LNTSTSTLDARGKLVIVAGSGVATRTTLIYDGSIFFPGPGLGGQDLTDSPSTANCAPPGLADRFVFTVLEGDPSVQVEISIEDTVGNIATITHLGLPTGSVAFPYEDFTNAANVDFTSVDVITVILSGTGTTLTLEGITTECVSNDDDDDGVSNDQDVCPASDLRVTVVFNTCNSGVRNSLFPSGCTLRDALADCTRRRRPRTCIADRTEEMKDLAILTDQQRRAINKCF
jgi:hypothetical protein